MDFEQESIVSRIEKQTHLLCGAPPHNDFVGFLTFCRNSQNFSPYTAPSLATPICRCTAWQAPYPLTQIPKSSHLESQMFSPMAPKSLTSAPKVSHRNPSNALIIKKKSLPLDLIDVRVFLLFLAGLEIPTSQGIPIRWENFTEIVESTKNQIICSSKGIGL